VCGDASSLGYGAYLLHGELDYPMALFFDETQTQLMQVDAPSTVDRDTKNIRLAVQCVLGTFGQHGAGMWHGCVHMGLLPFKPLTVW